MIFKSLFILAFYVVTNLFLSLISVAGTVKILDPDISFQAVHQIASDIWASGTNGGIYHSGDGGLTWQKISGPVNTENLQFRDIQPLADGGLLVMSAGEGESSRVYRSNDQGLTWQLQVSGTSTSAFFDCMHFTDNQNGWLYGDSDDEGLFILATKDGGKNWQRQTMPFAAQAGEGGFASSGTCVNQGDNGAVYIATGNAAVSRVLVLNNRGWQGLESPIAGGEASGIFSVQQADNRLFIFGGSLKNEQSPAQAFQFNLTTNEWLALPEVPLKGAIYGSALLREKDQLKILIANPQGVALWQPDQTSWTMLSRNNVWSLACDAKYGCIGVGKDGLAESFTFL